MAIVAIAGYWSSIRSRRLKPHIARFAFESFWFLLLVFLFSYAASRGADFFVWDEYSHWGAQLEYLKLSKELHQDKEYLLFPEYIPGASLWRALSQQFFLEEHSAYYFLGWVLIFSVLMSIIRRDRIAYGLFLLSFVFFCWLIFFQSLVLTLYVDHLQALLLFFALSLCIECKHFDAQRLMMIGITCAAITALKHVGLLFSLVVCGYLLIQAYVYRWTIRNSLIAIAETMLPVLLVYVSWEIYVKAHSLGREVFTTPLTLNVTGLTVLGENLVEVLANRFPHSSFVSPLIAFPSITGVVSLGWVILFCGTIIFSPTFLSRERVQSLGISAYFFACIVLYGSFLAYVRARTPWGGDYYSFSRYLCVLLFSLTAIQLLKILDIMNRSKRAVLLIVVMLIAGLISPTINAIFPFKPRTSAAINKETADLVSRLKTVSGNKAHTVMYLTSPETSLLYFVFRMYAMPIHVLDYSMTWAVTNPDPALPGLYLSQSSFAERLCMADHLVIGQVPSIFWNRYKDIINAPNGRIYSIEKLNRYECRAILRD